MAADRAGVCEAVPAHFADRPGMEKPRRGMGDCSGQRVRATTFATCDEIQQAWEVAKAVGNDRYAARRAFIDRYAALVDVSKGLGKKTRLARFYGAGTGRAARRPLSI